MRKSVLDAGCVLLVVPSASSKEKRKSAKLPVNVIYAETMVNRLVSPTVQMRLSAMKKIETDYFIVGYSVASWWCIKSIVENDSVSLIQAVSDEKAVY